MLWTRHIADSSSQRSSMPHPPGLRKPGKCRLYFAERCQPCMAVAHGLSQKAASWKAHCCCQPCPQSIVSLFNASVDRMEFHFCVAQSLGNLSGKPILQGAIPYLHILNQCRKMIA